MKQFVIGQKKVAVYAGGISDGPVIYLNTFSGEGGRVYETLQSADCPDFSLVEITQLRWDHDMSPWDVPPAVKNCTPCTGGADDYLKLLAEKIIPTAEKEIPGTVSWRGIAGYSLAGLFAVYALYQAGLFSRAASMSGSFWFPGFKEYVFSHDMKKRPEHLYFSLGDKESRTKNPYFQTVQKNTEEIEGLFRSRKIDTCFRLNPGGHFVNEAERTAAGIRWLLDR